MSKPTGSLNTEVLNKVQRLLIDFANEKGISLHDSFKTVDEFKQFVIALCIKTLVDAGISVQNAMNFIMGDGTYEEIAEKTWNHFNGVDGAGGGVETAK